MEQSATIMLFEEFTSKNIFKVLLSKAPEDLQLKFEQLKNVKQSLIWHPEGDVYDHIELVTNRLHIHYNDINLAVAGFFHDVGKLTTTKWNDKKQSYSAHGHEEASAKEVLHYSDWIKKLGADPVIVHDIVNNHMRVKRYYEGSEDEMRDSKKRELEANPSFLSILQFSKADVGGTSLSLK